MRGRCKVTRFHLLRKRGKCDVWSSTKILLNEADIQPKKYITFFINDSELFTDRYQTYNFCRACVGSARHEVSGESLKRKPRYSTKVTVFSKRSALITDRNQTHIFCSVSVQNARYDVSGKSRQLKLSYRWRGRGCPWEVPRIIDGSHPNRKRYSLEIRLCGLQ